MSNSSCVLLELCPNRQLLDADFNGYKLSLEQIPTRKKQFQVPLDRILIDSDSQYSYLHAKTYGLYNHLTGETINGCDSVYFIDKEKTLWKLYIDPFTLDLIEPIALWEVPKGRGRTHGDQNVSFKLISESSYAILGDGQGMLYVLETGAREDDEVFLNIHQENFHSPFVVIDAVFSDEKLQVLLLSIEKKPLDSQGGYNSMLRWVILEKSEENWANKLVKEFVFEDVQYIALGTTPETIYVISESSCSGIIDKPRYKWSQNLEEVRVDFPKSDDFRLELLEVSEENQFVCVKYCGETLLEGQLEHRVTENLTRWFCSGDSVAVVFDKSEEGKTWSKLLLDDENNKQLPPTTFNSQQMEDCDLSPDKTLIFQRISHETNSVSHKIHLGSHQVILTATMDEKAPPAIGLRHDVDVCLWQPQENTQEGFSVVHQGTLSALGYVEASKQQKKFCVCAPDLSYSAICESTRHVFIYRQNKPVESGELRHRATGRNVRNVAQQQVVSLEEEDEELLGCYASNKNLFLLFKNSVRVLQLVQD